MILQSFTHGDMHAEDRTIYQLWVEILHQAIFSHNSQHPVRNEVEGGLEGGRAKSWGGTRRTHLYNTYHYRLGFWREGNSE